MSSENAPRPLSRLEKVISVFCPLQPKDGRKTCVLGLSGFFLMLSYYLVRPVREALVLSQSSAEVRAYAVGGVAVLVLLLIPVYGRWLKTCTAHMVFQRVLLASILTFIGFAAAGRYGWPIGIPFFIWLGIFSLVIVAQYWAVAANIFGVKSGQRVLPAIAVGMSVGALVGSRVVGFLYPKVGPFGLMLLASALLFLHYCVQDWIIRNVCPRQGPLDFVPKSIIPSRSTYGFSLILNNSYLLKIAVLVTLMNWIDTAGDFILARSVQAYVGGLVPAGTGALQLSSTIGSIYAEFFFWICVLGLLFQVLAVSKIFRAGGVGAAMIVLPVILVVGYSVFGFVPAFGAIYLLKILEASVDYSIHGTAKHALFLPLNPIVTCHAKMTIDTFFWRFGDLIQALLIFVGLNFLDFGTTHFVVINVVLAIVCVVLAHSVGASYRLLAGDERSSDESATTASEQLPGRSRIASMCPRWSAKKEY